MTSKETTIGDVLRAAYRRAKALPWKVLPADASKVDTLERKAWGAQLSSGASFDELAQYATGSAIRFLAADDAEREQYDANHNFFGGGLKDAQVVLGAQAAGFKVDKGALQQATQIMQNYLLRQGKPEEYDKAGVPVEWAQKKLAQLHELVARVGRADHGARKAARVTRLKERAAAKTSEATAAHERSHKRLEHIPMGQPILVGHHSERRHRRDIERSHSDMHKAVAAAKEAEALERSIRAATQGKAISSDDPDSLEKLQARIDELEANRARWKLVNKAVRSKNPREALAELGASEATITALLTKDFAGRLGIPDYKFTNTGAEIRRLAGRLKALQEQATEVQPADYERGPFRASWDAEENRVAVYSPFVADKQERAAKTKRLRGEGFVWSPTRERWQRQANKAAWLAAVRAVDVLADAASLPPAPSSSPATSPAPSSSPATSPAPSTSPAAALGKGRSFADGIVRANQAGVSAAFKDASDVVLGTKLYDALVALQAEEDASPWEPHPWNGVHPQTQAAVIERGLVSEHPSRSGGFPHYKLTPAGRVRVLQGVVAPPPAVLPATTLDHENRSGSGVVTWRPGEGRYFIAGWTFRYHHPTVPQDLKGPYSTLTTAPGVPGPRLEGVSFGAALKAARQWAIRHVPDTNVERDPPAKIDEQLLTRKRVLRLEGERYVVERSSDEAEAVGTAVFKVEAHSAPAPSSARPGAQSGAQPGARRSPPKRRPKLGDMVMITGVRADGEPEFAGLTGRHGGFRGTDSFVDVAGIGGHWIATDRLVPLAEPPAKAVKPAKDVDEDRDAALRAATKQLEQRAAPFLPQGAPLSALKPGDVMRMLEPLHQGERETLAFMLEELRPGSRVAQEAEQAIVEDFGAPPSWRSRTAERLFEPTKFARRLAEETERRKEYAAQVAAEVLGKGRELPLASATALGSVLLSDAVHKLRLAAILGGDIGLAAAGRASELLRQLGVNIDTLTIWNIWHKAQKQLDGDASSQPSGTALTDMLTQPARLRVDGGQVAKWRAAVRGAFDRVRVHPMTPASEATAWGEVEPRIAALYVVGVEAESFDTDAAVRNWLSPMWRAAGAPTGDHIALREPPSVARARAQDAAEAAHMGAALRAARDREEPPISTRSAMPVDSSPIRVSDPDALPKLRAKLADAQKRRPTVHGAQRRNLDGEINRLERRIEDLEELQSKPKPAPIERHGFRLFWDEPAQRVVIESPDPGPEHRKRISATMKARNFLWSPKLRRYQRLATMDAWTAGTALLRQLAPPDGPPASAVEAAQVPETKIAEKAEKVAASAEVRAEKAEQKATRAQAKVAGAETPRAKAAAKREAATAAAEAKAKAKEARVAARTADKATKAAEKAKLAKAKADAAATVCSLRVAERTLGKDLRRAERDATQATKLHTKALARLTKARGGCTHGCNKVSRAECIAAPLVRVLATRMSDALAREQKLRGQHTRAIEALRSRGVEAPVRRPPAPRRRDGAPPRSACGTVCHIQVRDGVCGGQAAILLPSAQGSPREVPTRYCLVEAEQLVTSHQPQDFAPDPRYPAATQERRYDADLGEQLKVKTIAQNPRPELIFSTSAGALDGTPVATVDGIVLGGNGRTLGVKLHYLAGGQVFRDYLIKVAHEFGFTQAQIKALKHPVIVRTIDPPPAEYVRLVRDLNQGLTQSMDAITEGVSLARQMPADALNILANALGDGDTDIGEFFASRASLPFIHALERGGIITAQNRSRMIRTDGLLTDEGRTLAIRQLSAAILPDANLLELMGAELRQALARSAPFWLAAAGQGPAWDVRPPLVLAVRDLLAARAADLSLRRFFQQADLFDPPKTQGQPMARRLLVVLDKLGGKPAVLTRLAKFYASEAAVQSGHQVSLLQPKSPDQALDDAATQVKLDLPKELGALS